MQEDFLQYVWQHKKFAPIALQTTDNQCIVIKSVGYPNENSGPDFFNAQLYIDDQLWAGNVEIHVKSSDWYVHHHETNSAYDNVILHVVWEHNIEIFRPNNTKIPTLELKKYVNTIVLHNFKALKHSNNRWIHCEKDFKSIEKFQMDNWLERLYFERLERKSKPVEQLLQKTNHDWEAVLFLQLARAFGSKVNSEAFWQLAKSFPFSVFRKIQHNLIDLEALLFGQSNLLNTAFEDNYPNQLLERYQFIKHKYTLNHSRSIGMQFFRLRPPNFPTIRLAQLAQLYHTNKTVFSQLMTLERYDDFHLFFDCGTSAFWDTHYTFEKSSKKRSKQMSRSFIDIIIINAVIPMKYVHNKAFDLSQDSLLSILRSIPSEQNSIIRQFQKLSPISKSALESQALLELKSHYCDFRYCMQCAIGSALLNRNV